MSEFYSGDFALGILGGGQLGRMLIQEAINLDVKVHILDNDPNAPSSLICHKFTKGDITDFETVYQFGKNKNVVSIEIEHVNVDALKKLESEGVAIYPQPHLIEMVQDKGLQKEFYLKNNIPSAPFRLIASNSELESNRDFLPFVQKLRKGGYDGKGVQVMRTENEFNKGFVAPSVLEKLVDFKKELSVIVARNIKGEIKTFPLVELEFNPEANLVEYLFSPADVTQSVEEKAQKIAQEIIQKMNMVGLLAVELFLTKDDEVLVNEIAPRPHNSGHQTIEANYTSQYEQHLRAILGLPLGSTQILSPSVMINLLGEKEHSGKVDYLGLQKILEIEGVYPHLYGKATTKPFRKMGHITVLNKSLKEAKKIAVEIKETVKVVAKN